MQFLYMTQTIYYTYMKACVSQRKVLVLWKLLIALHSKYFSTAYPTKSDLKREHSRLRMFRTAVALAIVRSCQNF